MNPDDQKIVRFSNKTDFDFTPEMGAMYGGVPYTIPAGKSLVVTATIGKHFAKHLARQIIIRNAPIRDENETDGKGSNIKLFDEVGIAEMSKRFLSEMYEQAPVPKQTEAELMKAKIDALNREVGVPTPPAQIVGEDAPNTRGAVEEGQGPAPVEEKDIVYKDKGEVIVALTAKGIKFDARKSKSELEKLLA